MVSEYDRSKLIQGEQWLTCNVMKLKHIYHEDQVNKTQVAALLF